MIALVALMGLPACGGGGGGGGGDAGSGGGSGNASTPSLASAVRVTNALPASFAQTVPESANPAIGFEVSADITGDLARLSGETVFVLIEDARGLFELAGSQISPNGLGNRLTLRLKSTLGLSGLQEGSLRVNVCLDAACTRPLGNSPVLLPYRLTVANGVRLASTGPVVVDVPFGEPLPTPAYQFAVERAVSLVIPANLSNIGRIPPFDTGWTGADGLGTGLRLALLNYSAVRPGQTIDGTLSFDRRPIGTYVSHLKLGSQIDGVSGVLESLREVRYIVRASGVSMAFDASTSAFVNGGSQQFVQVTAASGDLYDRVSRIAFPTGTPAVQWLNVWLAGLQQSPTSRLFEVSADRCRNSVTCLPTGLYSADVFFATSSGIESPTAWRVTLQVQ